MLGNGNDPGIWDGAAHRLRVLDRLIEEDLDRTLTPFNLNRRQWQVLNVLAGSPGDASVVYRELNAFFTNQAQVALTLNSLVAGDWIETTTAREASLTDAGERRLAAALDSVRAARQRIGSGIEADQYGQTVNTLRSMCKNLGWTEPPA